MRQTTLARRYPRGSSGSAVVPGVVAIALLLLVFAGATNVVVDEYAKGALRTAVDEGAQAGAAAGGSLQACSAKALLVRQDLLPGAFGSGVAIQCTLQGDAVVASADGPLPSLAPAVGRYHVSISGFSLVDTGVGG